ncbi:MAG: toxin-antitoxin system antitoxin subunit [Deltaproteobacteria bacterium]|nr:toxin-antitoxin system antitoxin subunit [Deltaproteobacteria bacterium]
MTASKIAVSIPEHLLERARSAVSRGRAASVSAYVAAAIDQKSKLDDLETLLEEMLAETGGPLTAAERRRADRILGVRKTRKRRAA